MQSSKEISKITGGFAKGLSTFIRGFRYSLKDFKTFLMAFTPVLFGFFFLIWGFEYAYPLVSEWVYERFVAEERFSFWGGFIVLKVISFLIKLVSIILFILLSYILLQILYIPFQSLIAERILKDKGIVETKSFKDMLAFNFKMMRVGLLKAVAVALIGVAFFLSSFLPFFGFLPIYFGFLILAYDSYDYGLELYGLSLEERKEFFFKSFAAMNGHAAFLFCLSFLPGLVLLTMPFSVVGACLSLGDENEFKR